MKGNSSEGNNLIKIRKATSKKSQMFNKYRLDFFSRGEQEARFPSNNK